MANDNGNQFTRRDGTVVPIDEYVLTPAEMTTLYRLQEDFAQRGEHLSIKGVILHVLDKGVQTTRNYWAAVDRNKDRRDFAKEAAQCFNPDGSIRDVESLTRLAISKGLVRGSQREV